MADLVEETVQAIRARMSELAPVVAEYERLRRRPRRSRAPALIPLTGCRRAPARGTPRQAPGEGAGVRCRGRRVRVRPGSEQGGGVRRDHGRPGVTVTEIAEVTGSPSR